MVRRDELRGLLSPRGLRAGRLAAPLTVATRSSTVAIEGQFFPLFAE
jgi:hypothetical protein